MITQVGNICEPKRVNTLHIVQAAKLMNAGHAIFYSPLGEGFPGPNKRLAGWLAVKIFLGTFGWAAAGDPTGGVNIFEENPKNLQGGVSPYLPVPFAPVPFLWGSPLALNHGLMLSHVFFDAVGRQRAPGAACGTNVAWTILWCRTLPGARGGEPIKDNSSCWKCHKD